MKSIALLLALFIAVLISSANFALAQTGQKKAKTTAAILDLEPKGVSEVEIGAISDRLRYELFSTGTFDVLERGRMQDILKEQGFQQTGACNTDACAVEVGQLIGVQKMVAGSLSKVGKTFTIILRLIDVRTGRIEHSVARDYEGDIDKLMTGVIKNVAQNMAYVVQNKMNEDKVADKKGKKAAKPWYKKWWVWGGAGTAIVGGTAALLLGGSSSTTAADPVETIDNPPVHP